MTNLDGNDKIYVNYLDKDKAKADELREKMLQLLKPIIALIDEARSQGLDLSFQIGINAANRTDVQRIVIVRPL
jgi:hypothetical protein